jgi:hypothetical protein
MSLLDDLLEKIDPSQTIDQVGFLFDEALNSYEYPPNCVDNYGQFKKLVGDFYWHVESTLIGFSDKEAPYDWYIQQKACQLMDRDYGENGSWVAYNIALSGAESGLYGVFKRIGEAMKREESFVLIRCEVDSFLADVGESYLSAVHEYARKYEHLLPTEYSNGKLLCDFRDILTRHPYVVKRLRELGRT